MKKMNALLSALTLALVALTPMASSAANIQFKGDRTQMTVSKEYESSYTLIIPPTTQDLDTEGGLEVGATGYLHYDEKMIVSVASGNSWKLKDKDHEANDSLVDYSMKVGNRVITEEDSKVFEVEYSDNNTPIKVKMEVAEIGTPKYAGTYTDTLTFSVKTETISDEEESTEEIDTPTNPPVDDGNTDE